MTGEPVGTSVRGANLQLMRMLTQMNTNEMG